MRRRTYARYACPDDRDLAYRRRPRKTERTSRYWHDYRWHYDQGARPVCVGAAWAHWLQAQPIRQYLDPVGIYHLAQLCDEWEGTNYDGTSVRAGAKVLKHLRHIARYEWAWSVDAVANALLLAGPVVVGTDWYSGMATPDRDHVIRARGRRLGGHAYLLSGVDTRRGRARIKNSWGTSWGFSGHAWLPLDELEGLLRADGEACLGLEARPSPLDHQRRPGRTHQ